MISETFSTLKRESGLERLFSTHESLQTYLFSIKDSNFCSRVPEGYKENVTMIL